MTLSPTTSRQTFKSIFAIALLAIALSGTQSLAADDVAQSGVSAADYDQFGQDFAAALSNKDVNALSELFDLRGLIDIIADDLFDDPDDKSDYKRGFLSNGEENLIRALFRGWLQQDGNVRYIRTVEGNRPMIRLDYIDGGHEYVLFSMDKSRRGLVAVDMFTMTTGRYMSASMGVATQLMLKPTDSVLSKLFGNNFETNRDLVKTFQQLGELQRAADYRGAYDLLASLPEAVRNNRILVDTSVQLANMIGDAEYNRELQRLERLFGDDESASFMLIDYYFTIGNYDKAFASIDRLTAFLGQDAALENLRANLAYAAQDLDSAATYSRKAIQLEPDFEDAHWTLTTVLLDERRFGELVKQLKTIETEFGYEFVADDFNNETYAAFYESDARKDWLQ